MKRMITKSIALVALVGAMTAYSTSKAEATLVAYICNDAACDGAGDIIVTDGTASDNNGLSSGVAGYIVTGGTVGDYEITVNTAQNLGIGLDLNYTATNTTAGVAGDIWFWAVDTNFTGPGNISGLLGGTHAGGSVTAYICGGDDGSQSPVNSAPCDSATDAAPQDTDILLSHFASGNNYAFAIGVKISGIPGADRQHPKQTATGDFQATIPEPASMSLLGLGLAAVAAARRRRA